MPLLGGKNVKNERYTIYWHVGGKKYVLTSYKGRVLETPEDCERVIAEIWNPPEDKFPSAPMP